MTPKEQRDAAVKAAEDIVSKAKTEARDLTDEEATKVREHITVVQEHDAKSRRADDHAALLKQLGELGAGEDTTPETKTADSLGEHLVKSGMFDRLKAAKADGGRFSVSAPEFVKAPLQTGTLGQTQYGQVVPIPLRRVTVPQLLAQGTMNATSLTYFQQGAVTGDFAAVAQNATKPELTFTGDPVTETLAKVAGWTALTDEANEDIPAFVSVVEQQLLARHAIAEEAQVLNGSGTAPNLRGLLNRSGVQTEASAAAADNLDAVFRAVTKIQTATFLGADGIVINPTDYQTFRLSRDANEQYYGGGPFTGAYGNDGIQEQPGVWGLRTVVTQAIAAGTVLVGAFQPGGQLFRKGGVRVESTNTDQDDFINNRMKIRAESRLLLAAYYPAAFCKVTLSAL